MILALQREGMPMIDVIYDWLLTSLLSVGQLTLLTMQCVLYKSDSSTHFPFAPSHQWI